jgi:DNA-directed RNA polymerase subunit RPC12/RpoP
MKIKCVHCGDGLETYREDEVVDCTCGACSIHHSRVDGICIYGERYKDWKPIGDEK